MRFNLAIQILSFLFFCSFQTSTDAYVMPVGGTFYRDENSHVYFAQNVNSSTIYDIETPWLITYKKKLRADLASRGLHVFNANPLGESFVWTTTEVNVNNDGVYKGSISYGGTWGNNASMVDIAKTILSDNYPSVEIGLIVGSVLLVLFI